jgi:crotonobetainyl-CoA:carnitine CoA-transferase CaiB-like acyl-CoA transferase
VSDGALSGLVVLDLSEKISGPYCTKLLADCGAEVIKIESPVEGDPCRQVGPFPQDQPDPEQSGLFLLLNTGKKSVTLDLESASGAEIFKRLVERADMVVENYRPGVMAEMGIDYQTLSGINPSLIMSSISYFGQDGPYRDWSGCDLVAQAMGGLMAITGESDREPLMLPLCQAEFQAGLNAAVALLCALYFRDEAGDGQHIDISVQEAVASILEGALTTYSYSGYVMQRIGPRHQQKCPSTVMRAEDRFVHIQSGAYWDHFSALVEAPQLMEPPLASVFRYRYADEVEEAIRPWMEKHTAKEIFEKGQEWRIPVAMVLGIEELTTDPQYEARDYFREIDHPHSGRLAYPGAPFKMSQAPAEVRRAPLLGEHNEDIYIGMLELNRDHITQLKEHCVI